MTLTSRPPSNFARNKTMGTKTNRKGKGNKKKGPKGKKARAKAKLERQWGEVADKPITPRMSKSRLISSIAQNHLAEVNEEEDNNVGADRFAGSETKHEESSMFKGGGYHPYKSLLSQIQFSFNNVDMDVSAADGGDQDHGNSHTSYEDDRICYEDFSDAGDNNNDGSSAADDNNVDGSKPPTEYTKDLFAERFICADRYLPIGARSHKNFAENSSSQQKRKLSGSWDMQISSPALAQILPSKHEQNAWLLLKRQDKYLGSTATAGSPSRKIPLTRVAAASLNVISLYADLLVTDGSQRVIREQIQALTIRHILGHVYRYQATIADTEEHLKKAELDRLTGEARRDQGFVRPTILVLLPTRDCCFNFIEELTKNSKKPEAWSRFNDEYGPSIPPSDTDVQQVNQHRRHVLERKSIDWKELFSDEKNTDDDFKIGVQWNIAKSRFRLYTDFLKSDFIVASPLGLKTLGNYDCLSSIEICFVCRADVLAQQNWDHVNDVLEKVNQQPHSTNETDFSRVRDYFLSGKSKMWRQTIISASFLTPELLSSFRQFSSSQDGHVKIWRRFMDPLPLDARIQRQVFTKVPCNSFAKAGSSVVKYFFDHVFETLEDQTLVFISSYFDFVTIRNTLLRKEFDDFVSITEYSEPSEVTRGRARFRQRQRKILLYTGRAHFFMRHAIKGFRNVVFVGAPVYPMFYVDQVEQIELDENSTCQLLFTKFDGLALERIVGSTNCDRMIKGDKMMYILR